MKMIDLLVEYPKTYLKVNNEYQFIYIDSNEYPKIRDFFQEIDNANAKGDCKILFRGEKEFDYGAENIPLIFKLGSKPHTSYIKNKQDLQKRGCLKSIDDISEGTFEWIFDKITKALKVKSLRKISTKDSRMLEFIQKEQAFIDYFNSTKKEKFIESINIASARFNKLLIRNFYLYLLHTHGKTIINKGLTFFSSTSTDFETAKYFSNGGMVIICWIPKPFELCGISIQEVKEIGAHLSSFNLPSYSSDIFHEQNEFALLGGIFPQFIIGYKLIKDDSIILNPYLFEQENLNKNMIQNGLDIDQSDLHVSAHSDGTIFRLNWRSIGNGKTRFWNEDII